MEKIENKILAMLIGFLRKQNVIHVFSNVFLFRSAAWFYTKIYGYVLRESTNKINRLMTKTKKKNWIVNVFSPISYCERITQNQKTVKPNRHCKAVQFSVDKGKQKNKQQAFPFLDKQTLKRRTQNPQHMTYVDRVAEWRCI